MTQDDKLVYESPNGVKFYQNSCTESATEWANRLNIYNNIALKGWIVYLALELSGEKSYVLFNEKGLPCEASPSFEGILSSIDIVKVSMSFEKRGK